MLVFSAAVATGPRNVTTLRRFMLSSLRNWRRRSGAWRDDRGRAMRAKFPGRGETVPPGSRESTRGRLDEASAFCLSHCVRTTLLLATAIAALLLAAPAGAGCRASAEKSAELAAPGRFAVGFRTVTLVDASRPTPPNRTFPGAPTRTLRTEVWYSAAPGSTGADAPLDAGSAPYPLVLYGHALLDSRLGELYLTRHLASHGYVVAAPDFPLSNIGAPGGATVADLAGQPGDLRFVLAAVPGVIPGAVDGARVGVSGLSFGAITALLATYDGALREPRLRAVLPIAPPYGCALTRRFFRTTRVPLLVLHGDADLMVPPRENDERVFRRARGPRHLVTIHNGSHIGF